MPVTVHIRSGGDDGGKPPQLTFDGDRIAIGRGPGCEVRLPDPSVSHRHASLRSQGVDYVVVDEGSTNGTFVGGVRLLPQSPRVVRTGDLIRLGRVWIEVEVGQAPPTPDLGLATRDLALQLVARAMQAQGGDIVPRVRVAEGPDLGAVLRLEEDGRAYVIGRAEHADLSLADPDASREHLKVLRRGSSTLVVDLGSKNGATLGETILPHAREVLWRSGSMIRVGKSVLALDEPTADYLMELEGADDEALDADPETPPPPSLLAPPPPEPEPAPPSAGPPGEAHPMAPSLAAPTSAGPVRSRQGASRAALRPVDIAVIITALLVLGLSAAGLMWLLR